MSKLPEIYEGLVADGEPVFHYSPAIGFELHTKHQEEGIKILRSRRIYDIAPKNFWFKSPKKIKNYVPVRIIVEYL